MNQVSPEAGCVYDFSEAKFNGILKPCASLELAAPNLTIWLYFSNSALLEGFAVKYIDTKICKDSVHFFNGVNFCLAVF